jgi:DNA-binding MarR family transcriptional regulator
VKLTPAGRAQLHTASAAVKSVENRMLAELSADERAQAGRLLRTITTSLTAQS